VVREAEKTLMAALPPGALMQRAAAGLAAACTSLLEQVYGSRVAVLAGSGDNGGDALFAGALLAQRGARVIAVAAAARLHEAGAAALTQAGGRIVEAGQAGGRIVEAGQAGGRGVEVGQAGAASIQSSGGTEGSGGSAGPGGADGDDRAAILTADLVIDGLTGIGGHGGLREPAATLAALAERARLNGATVVAVDLPSGVDADTGEVHGDAVHADVTVTFGTWKPGLLIDPGASLAGAAALIDIGLRPYLGAPAAVAMHAADVAAVLPQPTAESDKYRRGVLGVLAGSAQYTGAAVLSVGAAIHGGAGMVRLVSAEPAIQAVSQHWPEAVLTRADDRPGPELIESAGQVQAWVAGPGMGTDAGAADRLAAVLATGLPVLVDADGITILAEHRELIRRNAPTVITPHAGELARLLRADRADIEARRLHYARLAAAELGLTVLLKGSTTVVADPDASRPVLVNSTGTSWLATAGSGDVLSGLTGSLLAQGASPAQAAAAAAFLHGLAGRTAADGAPIGASDLITALPAAIRTVTRPG
jgi:ADP-dependent NAD(P)H-hydrate dehydratase / NAD(P)H-hydrate epimerase